MSPAARLFRGFDEGRLGLFRRSRSGATAIEYALIAMLIAVALVGTVQLIGPGLSSGFDGLAPYLKPKT